MVVSFFLLSSEVRLVIPNPIYSHIMLTRLTRIIHGLFLAPIALLHPFIEQNFEFIDKHHLYKNKAKH
jgi:hypothetical protein